MIPEFMPGMIKTYRGGCSANSPFPPIFPPSAIADGEIGPNSCRLFRAAAFRSPGGGDTPGPAGRTARRPFALSTIARLG